MSRVWSAILGASLLLVCLIGGASGVTAMPISDASALDQAVSETSADLTDSRFQVDETASNSTIQQSTVQTGTVVNTSLQVQSDTETASYADPAAVRGELRTENGTAVANETIQLEIDNRTQTVTTTANGSFELPYRPQSVALGTQPITVRYVPNESSDYGEDSAQFTTTVTQVRPNISLDSSPDRLGYGETITVSTTVSVQGKGVEGVPVELRIDGTMFKRVQTDPNGSINTSIQLPATISAGETTVSMRIPYENQALEGAEATAPIVVEQQATVLTLNASETDGTVTASGRLQTDDGRPVQNVPVHLTASGQSQTVETNESGAFEGQFSTAALEADASSVTVTAAYDESNSNLEPSEESARVAGGGDGAGQPADAESDGGIDGFIEWVQAVLQDPVGTLPPQFLAALVTGLILLSLPVIVSKLGWVSRDTTVDPPESASPDESTTETGTTLSDASASSSPLDDDIEAYLDSGRYETAIRHAYAAVHDELTTDSDLRANVTHWELLAWVSDNEFDRERVEAIQTVVDAYETAAFSPSAPGRSSAESAIESARRICSPAPREGPTELV